jgi:hypothetical protein
MTIPEIAVLGAAGYVAWKNRDKIRDFLEERGIDVPDVLTKDLGELVQSGLGFLGNQYATETETASQGGTRTRGKRSKNYHDA